MDNWTTLKHLIKAKLSWDVHYSHSRDHEHNQLNWVLHEMEALENKKNNFLFTDVPSFDQKSWEKILEEKGLQGLS